MGVPDWVGDLVDLAAALAAERRDVEARAFERLRAAGREAEVEELLLQTYLFLGFPAALEAFRRWRTRGVEPPDPTRERPEDWPARGERVCAVVYGDRYEQLRQNVTRLHPDLDRWMVTEGYGKVLGRPGLELDVRERCIVAMLVVMGARRQLRSHLQGALNAGVDSAELEAVVRRAGRLSSPESRALADRVWSNLGASR